MRDGSTYEPYWDSWAAQEVPLAEDQVAGAADVRVLNRTTETPRITSCKHSSTCLR